MLYCDFKWTKYAILLIIVFIGHNYYLLFAIIYLSLIFHFNGSVTSATKSVSTSAVLKKEDNHQSHHHCIALIKLITSSLISTRTWSHAWIISWFNIISVVFPLRWPHRRLKLSQWHSLRTTLYSIDPASWGPESISLSMADFSATEQIWNHPAQKATGISLHLQTFNRTTRRDFVLWQFHTGNMTENVAVENNLVLCSDLFSFFLFFLIM